MKKTDQRGFTLIEMLVVIAVIAVLVAIIIPTVSSSTTRAKAAADAANLRSVLAEAAGDYLCGVPVNQTDTSGNVTVSNWGGVLSVMPTLRNNIKSKSLPDASLYVSNAGDEIVVAFQVHATHTGDQYYSIEDFARAAEGKELKPTGSKVKDPTIDGFPGFP